jgi:GT2 family glycosyltransferase
MQSEITAIIPTWRRSAGLRQALEKILICVPTPAEVVVHIDAGDTETGPMLEREFSHEVIWFQSETRQGPGGGRNLLLHRARYPVVASFDDDSWPLDTDYFSLARKLMTENPQAGVLTGRVTLRGETPAARSEAVWPVASFEGGACVYRREAFLKTHGFIPLRHAYGMEEVDVALQLMDDGWAILRASSLRVFHDSGLRHHGSPQINAAQITNTALLAYLRYPVRYWLLGAAQVLNRVRYAICAGRRQGVVAGLLAIPMALRGHRQFRKPVRRETILRSRDLAQNASKSSW